MREVSAFLALDFYNVADPDSRHGQPLALY
jgi:hypothetical protein